MKGSTLCELSVFSLLLCEKLQLARFLRLIRVESSRFRSKGKSKARKVEFKIASNLKSICLFFKQSFLA